MTKTFNLAKACGRESFDAPEFSVKRLYDAVPEDMRKSVDWLVSRTGLAQQIRHLRCIERAAAEGDDSITHEFTDSLTASIADLLGPVALDLAKCLGMIFHGTWDEIPKPYSLIGSKDNELTKLVSCGILHHRDHDEYTMPQAWQRYLWLRGRFVFGEKPYDLSQDWQLNIGIYEYALSWCAKRPPGWDEYQESKTNEL